MPIDKFPHYLQLDSMDCGPTCLRIIARYYGKYYTQVHMREKCYMMRTGVSMLGISDAAESIGFRTRGVSVTFEQLANVANKPCILYWNQNHFVVCYKIKLHKNGDADVYISDPATSKLTYTKDELLQNWALNDGVGWILLLEPGPDFKDVDEDKKETVKDLLYFLRYIKPYKSQFIQLIIGIIIGSILQLIVPFLTQSLVDVGIKDSNINFITLILIAQLLLFISQLSVEFIRNWILLHVNSRINISLISDFLSKLMKLPLKYFDSKNTGDILQRIGDHGRIKSFLMGSSISIVFSFANFVIFGAILAYYNWKILLIFMIGNTLYVIWILLFMKFRRKLDFKRFDQASKEQSKLIEIVQGMQEIKLNNCEVQKRWEWERIQVALFNIGILGLTVGQVQQIGSIFFTQTTSLIISFIAAKSVVSGEMTLGMMMALTYIIGQVSSPIRDFIGFAQAFQDAKISLERLNEVHKIENEEGNDNNYLLPENHDITLEHITFSYSGADRNYALDDVCIEIPQNKVTAIVGASGSGKTTIIKLIQGFYKPNKGRVLIGHKPQDIIQPRIWRSKTGGVMQDSYIFSDTIERNIAVSDETIDKDKLQNAIEVANLNEYISELPAGLKTKIGMEGDGTSQGQRQRILIARAVYKNPEFIFFDEATNSLDSNNEKIIMNNLDKFYVNKTVLISAHRLSTIYTADNIIVMDKGKVVEQGNHQELIKIEGVYYNLVRNQIELNN